MKHLIDNDVFVAALYRKHAAHAACRAWLDTAKSQGWGIAVETYLAAVRLLMNPAVMGSGAMTATEALTAIDTELAGDHPGKLILKAKKPDRKLLEMASGHRQVMDFWLIQIARDSGSRLATRDGGIVAHWPEWTTKVT